MTTVIAITVVMHPLRGYCAPPSTKTVV